MEGREVGEEGGQQIFEDVMDWPEVRRRRDTRRTGRCDEECRKERRLVQIFVNMDGSKTYPLDASLSDKVGDVVKRSLNSAICSTHHV